jgi:Ca-activated chloride channel family protein
MIAALSTVGPDDRFNVIGFRERPSRCFPGWVPADRDTTNVAARFIASLRAEGETDLFASLREILNLPRDPQRPVLAFVVTDGRPTAGLTDSSRIISEFTRQNDGAVSVFVFGTHGRANTYLLDLLTYCNRGAARLIRSGRWDIPDGIRMLVSDIRQPVMHGIRFAFDVASDCDVHPRLTTNLYADRPLELFGACPATTREVVFQLRGQAGSQAYDAVFRLDLARDGQPGNASLRERWAWQKMYSLISAYAREPRRVYMADLYRLSRDFGLPILYQQDGFDRQPVVSP